MFNRFKLIIKSWFLPFKPQDLDLKGGILDLKKKISPGQVTTWSNNGVYIIGTISFKRHYIHIYKNNIMIFKFNSDTKNYSFIRIKEVEYTFPFTCENRSDYNSINWNTKSKLSKQDFTKLIQNYINKIDQYNKLAAFI